MLRGLIAGSLAVFALAIFMDNSSFGGGDKVTIKDVMAKAMKGGLCAKVASGKASDDEKKALVACFTAFSKIPCPKGDEKDWKERTGALLAAAKADDGKALKKAMDCKGCHSTHK